MRKQIWPNFSSVRNPSRAPLLSGEERPRLPRPAPSDVPGSSPHTTQPPTGPALPRLHLCLGRRNLHIVHLGWGLEGVFGQLASALRLKRWESRLAEDVGQAARQAWLQIPVLPLTVSWTKAHTLASICSFVKRASQ